MSTMASAETKTTQVFRVYIKASPQAVWDAITKREWTERYGYGGGPEHDLDKTGPYRLLTSEKMKTASIAMGYPAPEVAVDGEVLEIDEPHKLVLTWRMIMDGRLTAEGFTRLTYEIDEVPNGVTKLTVVHELEGAPMLAQLVAGEWEGEGAGGGWSWVLSGLKTLLETGTEMVHGA
jgi:uncharacterized protein YndB with AHSA1/START domain